jgi:hypothetical protein
MAGSFQSSTCQLMPLKPSSCASCTTRLNSSLPAPLPRQAFGYNQIFQIQTLAFPGRVADVVKCHAYNYTPSASATKVFHTGLLPKPASSNSARLTVTSSGARSNKANSLISSIKRGQSSFLATLKLYHWVIKVIRSSKLLISTFRLSLSHFYLSLIQLRPFHMCGWFTLPKHCTPQANHGAVLLNG